MSDSSKKKIVFTSTKLISQYQEHIDRILELIGVNAWVSDRSRLSDFNFLDERDRLQLEEELGVPVQLSDYLVDIAVRMDKI